MFLTQALRSVGLRSAYCGLTGGIVPTIGKAPALFVSWIIARSESIV